MRKLIAFTVMTALLIAIVVGCGAAPPAVQTVIVQTAAPIIQTVIVAGTPQIQVITATPPPATAAPTTPEPTAVPPPAIKNPDTLVNATIGEPESLDPAWLYETAGGEVMQNVYDTLVTFKKDSVTDVVGVLASDWKESDDHKTFTFTMRKEPKFHSGNPVKASDVAYSFQRGMIQDRASGPQWIMLNSIFGLTTQRFLDKDVKPGDKTGDDVVNAQFSGKFADACADLQKRVVADDSAGTVTMTLAQPFGPFLTTLAGGWGSVVEKDAVVKLGGWDGSCATAEKFNDPVVEKSELFEKEVGSGPYKLDRWDHGNELDLVANDSYWLTTPLWDGGPTGAPKLKRVVIKTVDEWGTRYAMLLTGDCDFCLVPRANISQVEALTKEECDTSGKCTPKNANGFLRLFKPLPGLAMDALFFNWNTAVEGGNNAVGTGKLDGSGVTPDFFKDIHIRKAFNYCFNWDQFLKEYWKGEAIQAFGPIIQGELGFDANQPHYTFDIDKCKAEFEAASKDPGYEDLLTKGFFVQYTYNSGNTARQTAGQILKDGLTKANAKFKMSVNEEPWPVFLRDSQKSRLPLYQSGWLEDYHDPHDWVGPYLGSQGNFSGTLNFDKALSKQFDDLIAKGATTTDKNERIKIYQQLQNLSYENAVSLYLEQATGRHYEQEWIHGYYYNPVYSGFYYYSLSKGQ